MLKKSLDEIKIQGWKWNHEVKLFTATLLKTHGQNTQEKQRHQITHEEIVKLHIYIFQ